MRKLFYLNEYKLIVMKECTSGKGTCHICVMYKRVTIGDPLLNAELPGDRRPGKILVRGVSVI